VSFNRTREIPLVHECADWFHLLRVFWQDFFTKANGGNSTIGMKALSILILAVGILLLSGCATTAGHRLSKADAAEFERQLAKSAPVAEHGFAVKMVRLSHDLKKALVVFSHPSRADWEFVLQDDGFRRYSGMTMQPFYTPGTANTPPVWVKVTLPEE
jgi:hypothetical protein